MRPVRQPLSVMFRIKSALKLARSKRFVTIFNPESCDMRQRILSGKKSIFTFGNHPSMKIMAEQEMVTHVVRHDAGSVEHHLGPQVESEIRALTWS